MSECQRCGTNTVGIDIPSALRESFPGEPAALSLCPRCLEVRPLEASPSTVPDLQAAISDALPRDPGEAALVACILALVDRPTIHRQELQTLLSRAETRGVDVFLVLDRLAADPNIEPHFDLDRRGRQLEQLL